MGLDMYLSRKTSMYSWSPPEVREPAEQAVIIIKGRKGLDHIDVSKVEAIVEEVMYWRKSNQIHKWFVDNIQEGIDNCGEYQLSGEQLAELKARCDEVLADPNQAPFILPTGEGAFFGDYEYGQSYFDDVRETRDEIERLFKAVPPGTESVTYLYSSSW